MIATEPPHYVKYPLEAQRSILPPAEFDRPYTQGELIITRHPWQEISRQCNKQHALGCTRREFAPPRCYVAIAPDDELLGWDHAFVLRHEIGHCNGWKHQQPQRTIDEWCKSDPYLLVCR